MKDYDKNKESSYLQYYNINNLYGWAMSQKLPVNNFEWIEYTFQFNWDLVKNYNEKSDEGYFLEVYVQYLEKLYELHNDLPFLPERMKIEKFEKLVANLHDKSEYVIQIRNLKQTLNHRLVFKKVHKVQISFSLVKIWILIKDKKQEMIWKKILLIWWIMLLLEKLWKMWENLDILNLLQQKEEETIWCQNQIVIL